MRYNLSNTGKKNKKKAMSVPPQTKIVRYVLHNNNNLCKLDSHWFTNHVPFHVRKLLMMDKYLSDALRILNQDFLMQKGLLFPAQEGKSIHNTNFSCFSAFVQHTTVISGTQTPFAEEMLKQITFALDLQLPLFIKNDVVDNLLARNNFLTNYHQKKQNTELDQSSKPIEFENHSFHFDAQNVVPSCTNNIYVSRIVLTVCYKALSTCFAPPVPKNWTKVFSRVPMWPVIRLFVKPDELSKAKKWHKHLGLICLKTLLNKNTNKHLYFADRIADIHLQKDETQQTGAIKYNLPVSPLLTPSQYMLQLSIKRREVDGFPNAFLYDVPIDNHKFSFLQNRIVPIVPACGSGGYVCDRSYIDALPAFVCVSNGDLHTQNTLVLCRPCELYHVQKQCILHASMPIVYHGSSRMLTSVLMQKHKIVITTYNVLQSDFKKNRQDILAKNWHRILLLDSEYLSTKKKITQSVLEGLKGTNRWCVSSRPFIKKPNDIDNQLLFIKPPIVQTKSDLDWLKQNGENFIRFYWMKSSSQYRAISILMLSLWSSLCLFTVHKPLSTCERDMTLFNVPWTKSDEYKIEWAAKQIQFMLHSQTTTHTPNTKERTSQDVEQAWVMLCDTEFIKTVELQQQIDFQVKMLHDKSPFPLKEEMSTQSCGTCPVCLVDKSQHTVHIGCGHWLCHGCALHIFEPLDGTLKCPLCRKVAFIQHNVWRKYTNIQSSFSHQETAPCKLQTTSTILEKWISDKQAGEDIQILVIVLSKRVKHAIRNLEHIKLHIDRSINVIQFQHLSEPWFFKKTFTHVLIAQYPSHPLACHVLNKVCKGVKKVTWLRSRFDIITSPYNHKQYIGFTKPKKQNPSLYVSFDTRWSNPFQTPIFYEKTELEAILEKLGEPLT